VSIKLQQPEQLLQQETLAAKRRITYSLGVAILPGFFLPQLGEQQ